MHTSAPARRPARAWLLALALASPLTAQRTLHTFHGDSAGDWFGWSVAGAGDVDGDGCDDLIVGTHRDDDNGTDCGGVRVLSGRTGAVLYRYWGPAAGDGLGWSVAGVGDVDGDGHADFAAGGWGIDGAVPDTGGVVVWSGRTGAVVHVFFGDATWDQFGYAVAGAGDVNGDGWDDIVVGAQRDDDNGTNCGAVRVLSGRDGRTLHTFFGDSAGDLLGAAVAGAGDVDGDGWDDVIAGAYFDDDNGSDSGSARVWSGRTGAVLHTFLGDSADDSFGWSVARAGDVDRDGFGDVIVGTRYDDNNGVSSGLARVFSGATGAVLYSFDGSAAAVWFGNSVAGGGDVDGDGVPDFVVGAPLDDQNSRNDSGSVLLISGRTGAVLQVFAGDSQVDNLGFSVAMAGDVNGDGFADFIAGAPFDDDTGNDAGSARVWSGFARADAPLFRTYGAPCASSKGTLPRIGARGRAAIGGSIDVTLRAATALSPSALNFDVLRIDADMALVGAPGCRLLAMPAIVGARATDLRGHASATLPLPNDSGLLGLVLYAQWLVFDPRANTLGVIGSDGAMLRVGR